MFEKQLRSLKRRYHLLDPVKRVRRNGIAYELDCRELIDYNIYLGVWEDDTFDFIENNLKEGFVTMEIGANIGAHTLLIARKSGESGTVYAIEPTDYARTKLLKNISLNPDIASRIHVHNFLISDTVEENPRRDIRSSWPAKAKMEWKPKEQVSSPVTTVDSLASDLGLTRLDLIKIDIDGYDFRALVGAAATIEKFKPLIFVELSEWALQENGSSVAEILELLTSKGYRGYDANEMHELSSENVLARLGQKDSINGVFFHGP
jgi:FkbM family methyltransferase